MSIASATHRTLILALALYTTGACHDGGEAVGTEQQELNASKTAEAEVLPANSIKATMPQLSAEELLTVVHSIEPQKARNGGLRYSDARLDTPAAAPALLEKLQRGGSEAEREALILALPRTQGDYAAAALELLKTERSEGLRAALVDSMRLAQDAAPALEALKLGLVDTSATVRARAAFNIGRRADGLQLVDALIARLDDRDAEVQTAAVRALGQLGATRAFEAAVPLMQSRDADTRLESIRALARMDAQRASALTELHKLANDGDERIRTAVAKAQNQAY